MKLFVIGAAVPCTDERHPFVTAVEVVAHELLVELAALGHEVVYQPLFNPFRADAGINDAERHALAALPRGGVGVLPPFYPHDYLPAETGPIGRLAHQAWRLAGGTRFNLFYPSVRVAGLVTERVRTAGADAVLTLWSPEGLAATHFLDEVPRIAYHGDIDFIPERVRQIDAELFGMNGARHNPIGAVRRRLAAAEAERAHWQLMQRVSVVANVTASNVGYYRERGHRRSVYVRNTWIDRRNTAGISPAPHRRGSEPIKIIGHVGHMGRTGSTYGLRFLLQEVVPSLRETMGDLDYRIEIIGGGQAVPALRPWLAQDRVVVRGFVEDLSAEFDSCDAMLLLNNAGSYQAAFTRHLVAWARSLCLIVHQNSSLAMPEIEAGQNALVGSTGPEIARLIRLAVTDPALNTRIGHGGRATYDRWFTPPKVAGALGQEIRSAVDRHKKSA